MQSQVRPQATPVTRVAVYCGSAAGADPLYLEQARMLGAALVRHGMSLVYGGATIGLMGAVADAVLEAGGEAVGVLPRFLAQKEIAHSGLSRFITVETMHERKQMMADLADAFIALPGGYGTLEELAEVLTWAQLGLHGKAVGLLNVNGFYEPLLALLDRMAQERFMQPEHRRLLLCAAQPEELLQQIQAFTPVAQCKVGGSAH